MIRAVLFDLDRTLVDCDTSTRTFFRDQWELCRALAVVRGAKGAGLKSVWLADPQSVPSLDADVIITSLDQLESALASLDTVATQSAA
jgi:FMN phosphatase YigB (HAD superfamily)